MKFTLITNNIDLYEKVKNKKDLNIIFDEKYTYGDVLDIVKKKLQNGFELSTHPLCGSIKPNETPYRSILITKTQKPLDLLSGFLIYKLLKRIFVKKIYYFSEFFSSSSSLSVSTTSSSGRTILTFLTLCS